MQSSRPLNCRSSLPLPTSAPRRVRAGGGGRRSTTHRSSTPRSRRCRGAPRRARIVRAKRARCSPRARRPGTRRAIRDSRAPTTRARRSRRGACAGRRDPRGARSCASVASLARSRAHSPPSQSDIQPARGARAYERLASGPWSAPGRLSRGRKTRISRLFCRSRGRTRVSIQSIHMEIDSHTTHTVEQSRIKRRRIRHL